ncbi:MAG: DUF1611 domain-containing protein [Bacteroidia bacterium]|nr:DUF1611 domain-containing protein [Bacteroidia bacterium]
MKDTAVILTSGLLTSNKAKTAHGLIRGTDRFDLVGVIDDNSTGKDAGIVLDGQSRDIPIFGSIDEAIQKVNRPIRYCIIGVATPGGIIPKELQQDLMHILDCGVSVINGLHHFLGDLPEFVQKANDKKVELLDIRKGKPKTEQNFWSGRIYDVHCPIVAILGTDCALGKRTTTRILVEAAEKMGVKASMVYTGQTGWLQGKGHGFIFDSTVNDFVSGELENAVVSAYHSDNPQVIYLEGQASLLNPSGPCGSEYLVSANAKKVILQHAPARVFYKGWDHLDLKIPSLKKNIALIKMYDSEVIAIALNVERLSPEEIIRYKREYESELGIPAFNPIGDDVSNIVELSIQPYISQK